jgi:hypothetical protein
MQDQRTARPEAIRRLERITRDMSGCFDQFATAVLNPDADQRRAEVSVLAARISRDWERIACALGTLADQSDALRAARLGVVPPLPGRVRPVELRLVPEAEGEPSLDYPSKVG